MSTGAITKRGDSNTVKMDISVFGSVKKQDCCYWPVGHRITIKKLEN